MKGGNKKRKRKKEEQKKNKKNGREKSNERLVLQISDMGNSNISTIDSVVMMGIRVE